MSAEMAIQTVGLTKSYRDRQVLAGVDLEVRRGSIFALLGPNGAGKTTMVRILATLVRPDAGRATVAGFDVSTQRRRVRREISLTGQDVALDELQTGEENLRMMAALSGVSGSRARSRASELLDQFGLQDARSRRVANYSGGMRRRLDLATGLVGNPSVIFLDEPTTGLDLPSRQAMWQVITDLVRTGVTVFLTTQYLEEADQLADQIAVVNGGALVAQGSPAQLKARVAEQRLDIILVDDRTYEDVTRSLGARVLTGDAGARTVSIATDGTAPQIRSLLDEIDPGGTSVLSFRIHAATLDDVFLALTGSMSGTESEPVHA